MTINLPLVHCLQEEGSGMKKLDVSHWKMHKLHLVTLIVVVNILLLVLMVISHVAVTVVCAG